MFQLMILTPEGKIRQVNLRRISIPTSDGIRTILANHMDLVASTDIGHVHLIDVEDGSNQIIEKKVTIAVSEGIFSFADNQGRLFVRTFEFPDEIDYSRAQRAKERAQERLKIKEHTQQHHEAELALKRALSRLSI